MARPGSFTILTARSGRDSSLEGGFKTKEDAGTRRPGKEMDSQKEKGSFKTIGTAGTIRASLEKIPGIVYAFTAGAAKDVEDPGKEIEIIVVGGPDLDEMEEVISEVEKRLGRTIRISSFTVSEFRDRVRAEDDLVAPLIEKKKVMLIGNEDELISL
jgi:hypothetical protein